MYDQSKVTKWRDGIIERPGRTKESTHIDHARAEIVLKAYRIKQGKPPRSNRVHLVARHAGREAWRISRYKRYLIESYGKLPNLHVCAEVDDAGNVELKGWEWHSVVVTWPRDVWEDTGAWDVYGELQPMETCPL